MTTFDRYTDDMANTVIASATFIFALAVYTLTMTPTVPFWDSGEYIATSYILGVPHAPGTPLYVLLGRMFTFIPFGNIAQRVNWFSALSSAIAVLFTYLITVRITLKMFREEDNPYRRLMGYVAGVVAALIAGFATTFWDNAVEAEVYAASCALMGFVVWLVLRWEEREQEVNADGLLLLITYLVGLGVGIHLGVAVAAWATVIFVFLTRPEYLTRWSYLGWGLVTLSMATGVHLPAFLVAPAVLALTLVFWLLSGKLHKLAFWSSLLFMVGISVHFFLIIRSNLDPIINEAAPKTWEALWLMLIRDQYKPPPITQRKAEFWYQFDHMYLRYMWWNFTLFVVKGKAFFQLPILLAVFGVVVNFMRDRRSAILVGVLFMLLGPAMVLYLNFKVGEVRERDYFFVQNFQFLSIWVGVGAAVVMDWLRRQVRARTAQRAVMGAAATLFLVMSLLPLVNNWWEHDRRGFYVARDYAYNMLTPLEPDAVIFTNGDNDTFPLWYLQEVEGIRKDVRVVNLSLLNTDWYIKQIRDLEPKVPISFTDDQIALLRPYRDREGKIWLVKDIAVRNIVDTNAWQRPVYIAVTVPDVMGFDDQLRMEGLVFRMNEGKVEEALDFEKTMKNLNEVFRYDGLVFRDETAPNGFGHYDSTVYKTGNAQKLVQNYAAAYSRLAIKLFDLGREEEALQEMDKADLIAPSYPGAALGKGVILERLGRQDEAMRHYLQMIETYPGDWQLHQRMGQLLVDTGQLVEALWYFDRASRLDPTQYYPYQGLVSVYYELGRYEEALGALERLAIQHPEDRSVRQYINELRESLRTGSLPSGDRSPDQGGGSTAPPDSQ